MLPIEDEVVDYLLRDNTKFRIFDLVGNQNRWSVFNIENVNGYHPAKLNFYNEMLKTISKKGGAYPYGLLQALNIKYILHGQKGRIQNFNLIDRPFKYLSTNITGQDYIDTYIYKNQNSLERIFIVNNVELINNDEIIINNITNQSFDPIALSYINKNDLNNAQIEDLENLEQSSNSSINLVSWETDKIIFEADFDKPQLVCLSEIFYPGWSINNEEIDIININGLF